MDEEKYQSITNINTIAQYVDDMGGFHDFSAGNIHYDDDARTLSVAIEEVIEGEDWPRQSSGRVWFLNFDNVSDIEFDIDVPMGFWISDIVINEDGSFVIESDQGSISVLAEGVELSVPAGEIVDNEGEQSLIADKADDAPLNPKTIFNDIKGVINRKRDELAPESSDPVAVSENAAPTVNPEVTPFFGQNNTNNGPNPFLQPTPSTPTPAQPVAQPVQQPVQPIAPQPNIQPATPPDQPINGPIFS